MSTSQVENLISQVIDGNASSSQWNELTQLAENNPQVWRDLANTLRDHQSFARSVNTTVAAADDVPLPENIVEPSYDLAPGDPSLRPRRLGHWGGWAVAAMIALAWIVGFDGLGSSGPGIKAGLDLTAAEYLDKYKEQGRKEGLVYDELEEKVILDRKLATSGKGYEILYIRQIVEKVIVPDLYQVGSVDETGRLIFVPLKELPEEATRSNN